MFESELKILNMSITEYARQSYDAVWTIALALKSSEDNWRAENKNLRIHNFDYSREDMAEDFINQLSQINFLGVSVFIKLLYLLKTNIN